MTEREIPASTENHLDLSIVAVADRTTDVGVVLRELGDDGALGDALGVETWRFRVRGQLPVPVMTSYLRLETQINEALASSSDTVLEEALQVAHARIVSELTVLEPTKLEPTTRTFGEREVRVKPTLELDSSQILVFLAWLAGDVSVADRITKALTAGVPAAPVVKPADREAYDSDDAAGDAAAEPEAAAQAPLASS